MGTMRAKVCFLILVLVLCSTKLSFENSKNSTNNYPNYPEVAEYTFPYLNQTLVFNSKTNISTKSFNLGFSGRNISGLGDITVLSFDLFFYINGISYINITLSLNGLNATNYFFLTQYRYRQTFNFIVDEQSHLILQDYNNVKISFSVGFTQNIFTNSFDTLNLTLQQLVLKTAFRQNLNFPGLNENTSRITALIINPYYQIPSERVIFQNTPVALSYYVYKIDFLVILPQDIAQIAKQTYLNITFSYNADLVVNSFSIENFAVVASSGTATSVSYLMKYLHLSDRAVAQGYFTIDPKTEGMYNIHTFGQFFVSDQPAELFPKSVEMSIALFLTVTLVIPIALLSKLIYRRLLY